ncbi:sensor histidine kinase [Methanogenium marinum]|uniref:Sensor histidine kinase n=1 Tax=Methanogenium marinum TaxID=348610 RepID=A0A9Q4PW84_9EURY|nr:sensor histidine kinase [Methanogenium marinum]MDE4908379.1 sensor histidine kinase [Methanogenium marinum]
MNGHRGATEGELNKSESRMHRGVADDLRVIAGLFDIRMAQTADEDALHFMRELLTLTKVMAIVHGIMYMSGTPTGVDTQLLFDKIAKSVRLTHCTQTWVVFSVKCGETLLPATCAVPCAFVLAEIIRNSLLYSFEGVEEGKLEISFTGPDADGWYTLVVADDGFPEYAHPNVEQEDEAISMSVAEHIVRYRLRGTTEHRDDEGTTWKIRFPGEAGN